MSDDNVQSITSDGSEEGGEGFDINKEDLEEFAARVNKAQKSFLFKAGVFIIALKVVDVIGRVAIEKVRSSK
jgi:hypothetical protein